MKKTLALLLCLLLVAAGAIFMTSCSDDSADAQTEDSEDDDDEEDDKDKDKKKDDDNEDDGKNAKKEDSEIIVNTWYGTLDAQAIMELATELVPEDAAYFSYANWDGLELDVIYDFDDKGVCTFEFDEDSKKKFAEDYYDMWGSAIEAYIEEQIYEEDITNSVEEILDEYGITLEELTQERFGGVEEALDKYCTDSRYEVKDGQIYIAAGKAGRDKHALYYEFEDDETLILYVGRSTGEDNLVEVKLQVRH